MKNIYKISILIVICILTLSVVSANDNSTTTQHTTVTKNTDNNIKSDSPTIYTVSPNGKGVGKTDGNLFETIDHIEEEDTKATVNLKSGTYKFNNQTINGTYQSNRRLGKNNLKNISFIGNNTIFKADNVRFFNIQEGTTAEFINIIFTGGVATSGGSIYSEGNLILKNCSFTNSTSQRYGGTLYLRGDNTIENTDFTETHTTDSRGSGGVIYTVNSTLKMNNIKVNHAVANKTAGLLAAINSKVEFKYINVNDTYTTDIHGYGEIIHANNSKLLLDNILLANKTNNGGLLAFYSCDTDIINITFNNFLISKGSFYSLIYNDNNLNIINTTINNVTCKFNQHPFIFNNGTLNMTNLNYLYHEDYNIVLQNNKTGYLTGCLNNIIVSRSGKLFLKNINQSTIKISNEGETNISNIQFSNLDINGAGGLKVNKLRDCIEHISVWFGELNDVVAKNPLSQWSVNVVNITNSGFNNVSTIFYASNITNTTFVDMPVSLLVNKSNINHVSFINNSVDCITLKGNGNVSIYNSVFLNNKCNYTIQMNENSKIPEVYMTINNTDFANNTFLSPISSSSNADRIYIQNSSFINNTFINEWYGFLITHPNNAYIKNNTYIGNNLSSNIIGSMTNSLVYNNPLKATLRVITKDIFNTTINTGKASIYVDNKLYGNYGVFDGYIYVTVYGLSKGNHVINVKYSDDTYSFMPSEKSFNVIVADKILTKVIAGDKYAFAGSKITFNASVVDYNNKPITTGRIVIKINGITLTSITLKNTNKITYNYTVPNYTAKDYKLQYVYVGDDKYARYEANKTLHLRNQSALITANNVVNYQNQSVAIKVRVVGKETGISAAVGTVGFKINGQTAKINGQPILQKVKDGWVTFNYRIPKNMKADKYQIMVTYSGGRNLLETRRNTSTLTVKDHTTKINIQTTKLTQSKTNKIIAQVKDSVSDIKSGRANLKIGSDTVSETVINNGQAVFKYYVPSYYLGKHDMTVTAKGTYTDENSSKITITVVK